MVKVFDATRGEYSKKRKNYDGCFFCDEEVIEEQECTIFTFSHWMVLVNKYPYMNGNVMLVPRDHKTKISQITHNQWQEFPATLNKVQAALTELFDTESFNIGLNEGEHSGGSVEHLHWQIIPRKRMNHTAIGVLADIQVITVSAEKLKKMLSK